MNTTVIVPWRSSKCGYRKAAWKRSRRMWAEYGCDVVTADDGGQPFSRGCSINDAADRDGILILADADVLISHVQVRTAVRMASESPGLVVAFTDYRYLTRNATRAVLAGGDPAHAAVEFVYLLGVSCVVVISADAFREVGGFDPRFRAWGGEDLAFEHAVATLCGPTRKVDGPVYHLWHPLEMDRPRKNIRLAERYDAARGDRTAMRSLIDEVSR